MHSIRIMDFECFKETKENWCGSYEMGDKLYLRVKFSWLMPSNQWRVGVWGNDDFGMTFDSESKDIALNTFYEVVKLQLVTQDKLEDMGFETF